MDRSLVSDLPEVHYLPHGATQIMWRRSSTARQVSLRIDPRLGGVVITLPMRAAKSSGLALLRDNALWVAERLRALPTVVDLADGASVMVGGMPHRVCHVPGARGGAWLRDGVIEVAGEPEFLARRVSDLLRAEAKRQFSAMIWQKAAKIARKPSRVAVKDTRSRWGSCTADGVVMVNWRLIMAPEFVQDYVVAHEVAHLRHLDHSARFWSLVAELTPHCDRAQAWLKQHGAGLLRVR